MYKYDFSSNKADLEEVVFLLTLNRQKLTERIIIGKTSEVRLRLERNMGVVLYDSTSQIGQLLINFDSDPHQRLERQRNISRR